MTIEPTAVQFNANVTSQAQPRSFAASASGQTPAKSDSVQLSSSAPNELAYQSSKVAQASPPTLDQIIKLAADGDIAAIAQLTLT